MKSFAWLMVGSTLLIACTGKQTLGTSTPGATTTAGENAAQAGASGQARNDAPTNTGGTGAAASAAGANSASAAGGAGTSSGAAGGGGTAASGGVAAGAGAGAPASVMDAGHPPPNADAGAQGTAGAGGQAASADTAPATVPIDPPLADDCITDVKPGDHTFICQKHEFLVMVDERCTHFACGLIFDVHGATMTGAIQRSETHLHELAPKQGYLTVHPTSATGTWDWDTEPPVLVDFMTRMTKAFHVDQKRVHVTGFSMGSAMTFWFLCNHKDVLASTAPVTGSSAEQVTDVMSGKPCIGSIDATWQPRVPILFMSGTMDPALMIADARARTDGIVTRLGLTGGKEIENTADYTRKRWEGDGGMVFDFIEHNYSSGLLGGHCIPGGVNGDLYACTNGTRGLQWGQVVLKWFLEHPKR